MTLKPPPSRLYGRQRGHKLRPRQELLLEKALPSLSISLNEAENIRRAFYKPFQPLWLEVGFGGGEHAARFAKQHPERNLIACEVYQNGICSLLNRLYPDRRQMNAASADSALSLLPPETLPQTSPSAFEEEAFQAPPNFRVYTGDARGLIESLHPSTLHGIILMFPDPWPKARHAKRRFVHPFTLPLVARALRLSGIWRIASDDPTYQAWVDEVFANQTVFEQMNRTSVRPSSWPPTRYETKAKLAERPIVYWEFKRIA